TSAEMNEPITIYHNPRCSKSRETLALLQSKGVTPNVVLYLETPLNATQLRRLLKALSLRAPELIRVKEDVYKSLNPERRTLSENDAIAILLEHPKLIERPIVVRGDMAVIRRPPERVLQHLP